MSKEVYEKCGRCEMITWAVVVSLSVLAFLAILFISGLDKIGMEAECKLGGYADIEGIYGTDYCVRLGPDGDLVTEPLETVRSRLEER